MIEVCTLRVHRKKRCGFKSLNRTLVLPYAHGELKFVLENYYYKIYLKLPFTTQSNSAKKHDMIHFNLKIKVLYKIELSELANAKIIAKEEEKLKYKFLLEVCRLYQSYKVY